MSAETNFKHGEYAITLGPDGKFTAIKDGKKVAAGSLAGIKKKLDAQPAFEPFHVLVPASWNQTTWRKVQVVSRRKSRQRWREQWLWVLENGDERESVIEDTPENQKLLDEQQALKAEKSAVLKKLEHAERDLAEKITRLDASKTAL